MSERERTAAVSAVSALGLTAIRQFGSDVTHLARGADTYEATVFEKPCTMVVTPCLTSCGSLLRGDAVEMTSYLLPQLCPRCRLIHPQLNALAGLVP